MIASGLHQLVDVIPRVRPSGQNGNKLPRSYRTLLSAGVHGHS
jgi:hypothetical protein